MGSKSGGWSTPAGKVHVVGLRVVVGIHGGRGHEPLLAVHRLADFRQLAPGFELDGALHVAGEIAGLDAERGVVAPLVGVADLVDHGVQLFERLLAGGFAHPGKLAKVGVHGLFDLLDHGERLALDVAGEGLGHEDLSQRFAQILVHQADAALPSRRLLLARRADVC